MAKTATREIVKWAVQNPNYDSKHFHEFEIEGSTDDERKAIHEFAKIAAKKNGRLTSEHIHTYNIDSSTEEGQNSLMEIAMNAVQSDNIQSIAHFIHRYRIDPASQKGQAALIEIAKLNAKSMRKRPLIIFKISG